MSNIETAIAWGDTHPDEETAASFMQYLSTNPVPSLKTGSVNERAVAQGRVRIAQPDGINMAGAYPGDLGSEQYEERRAAEVLEESRKYSLAIEVHNLRSPSSEPTALVDPNKGVSAEVLGFIAGWASNLVVNASLGMVPHLPHAFAIELSPRQQSNFSELREGLNELINHARPCTAAPDAFRWFRFVQSLNVVDLKPGTDLEELAHTPGFTKLPRVILPPLYEKWGVAEAELFTMYQPSERPNLQGFIGELVAPIEIPNFHSSSSL